MTWDALLSIRVEENQASMTNVSFSDMIVKSSRRQNNISITFIKCKVFVCLLNKGFCQMAPKRGLHPPEHYRIFVLWKYNCDSKFCRCRPKDSQAVDWTLKCPPLFFLDQPPPPFSSSSPPPPPSSSSSPPPFPPFQGFCPPSGCLLLDTSLGRDYSECIIMLLSHHPSPLATTQHSKEVEEVPFFLLKTKISTSPADPDFPARWKSSSLFAITIVTIIGIIIS